MVSHNKRPAFHCIYYYEHLFSFHSIYIPHNRPSQPTYLQDLSFRTSQNDLYQLLFAVFFISICILADLE